VSLLSYQHRRFGPRRERDCRRAPPHRRNCAGSAAICAWLKSDAKAPFPVLTDMDNGYATTLDLSIYVGDELKQLMVRSGWDPSVSQRTDNWTLPIPATFIVDTEASCARALSILTTACVCPSRT
jgi:hypothetical protein